MSLRKLEADGENRGFPRPRDKQPDSNHVFLSAVFFVIFVEENERSDSPAKSNKTGSTQTFLSRGFIQQSVSLGRAFKKYKNQQRRGRGWHWPDWNIKSDSTQEVKT